MEAFVFARLLEHVQDWKTFIIPFLYKETVEITKVSIPHHLQFGMEGGRPRVQHMFYTLDQ
jgi:hypothetical protein